MSALISRQESYKEKQKLAFIAQIKIAVEHNLPIVIHCRDAEQDCWDIMEEVIVRMIFCCVPHLILGLRMSPIVPFINYIGLE